MNRNEANDVDKILDNEFQSIEDFLLTTIINAISHYSISIFAYFLLVPLVCLVQNMIMNNFLVCMMHELKRFYD
jgi:hypothetical protein